MHLADLGADRDVLGPQLADYIPRSVRESEVKLGEVLETAASLPSLT